MKLNLNKFLFSISYALDMAEKQITNVSKLHSKRVAFISVQLADVLELNDEEKFDLYAYSLLHDNGLIEAFTNNRRKEKDIQIDENFKDHCTIGEENIKPFPFLTGQKDIIRYHHERYDGSGFFGKKGDEIPLMAQIIYIANTIDESFDLSSISLTTKKDIVNFVKENENTHFSPKIVSAFLELSNNFNFWGSLDFFYMVNNPDKLLTNFEVDISLDQFYDMIQIYSNIIDSKSKFTAKHSKELVEKTEKLVDQLGFDDDHKKKILIAANLHDIGKLATPIEILEKEGSLNEDELFEIQKHAYFTFALLDGIEFCDDILYWASHHHEKPDGKGYPFGVSKDDLSLEARFVACLDFYQALIEDRPYRKAMPHDKAIKIMKEHLTDYYVDFFITDLIDNTFGENPAYS